MFACFISYSQNIKNDNFYIKDTFQISLYNKAQIYIKDKKYVEAIGILNKSLEINSNNELATKIYYKIGTIYYTFSNY